MSATNQTALSTHQEQFLTVAIRALVRAEVAGRVPERFTGEGPAVWEVFDNELNLGDRVALAIEDAGAVMPVPFDPRPWWPGWPEWALRNLPPAVVAPLVEAALREANQPESDYLRQQAAALDLDLPREQQLAQLPTPAAHESWLELPDTAGWVAYHLCSRPGANLYLWQNFTIVCTTPQQMLFAGLLAWELDAPPGQRLPLVKDDGALTKTLEADRTYQGVVAQRALHGHRALDFLVQNGAGVLWI